MYVEFCRLWTFSKRNQTGENKDLPVTDHSGVTRLRLFQTVAVVLSVICLSLLIVILALSVKLQRSNICPAQEDVCSKETCMSIYTPTTSEQVTSCSCLKCEKGWVNFEGHCFFLSRERQTWLQSRWDCRNRGGDLAILSQERIQEFLSAKSNDLHWIGLRRMSSGQWAWIDNSTLVKSHWSDNPGEAECAYLNGNSVPEKSWETADCSAVTYYICQKNR